jgi:hypothetical protein
MYAGFTPAIVRSNSILEGKFLSKNESTVHLRQLTDKAFPIVRSPFSLLWGAGLGLTFGLVLALGLG